MQLAELQRAMQASVSGSSDAVSAQLKHTAEFDTAARLNVYQHAFIERLVGALRVNYPATYDALGNFAFRELTHAYVQQHPPHHFSIRYFGDKLATFTTEHLPGTRAHGLSELARWEWTLATAFDAADHVAMSAAALASIAPEQWPELRFEFASCLQRLALTSNAVPWWRASTQQAPRPSRWRKAKRVDWAVWRQDLKTFFRSLDGVEAAALDAARDGRSFDEVCGSLAHLTNEADAPLHAARLLHGWVRDGWIVALRLSSPAADASTSTTAPCVALPRASMHSSPATGRGEEAPIERVPSPGCGRGTG